MKGWKSPCGIHLVRTARTDIKVSQPCPYCQAVIQEVKTGQLEVSPPFGRSSMSNAARSSAERRRAWQNSQARAKGATDAAV